MKHEIKPKSEQGNNDDGSWTFALALVGVIGFSLLLLGLKIAGIF